MAQWNVEGADPKTGDERLIQVAAETKEEAERKARKQGLLVSAVYKSTVQTSADALDDMVASASSRSAPPPITPTTQQPALSYRAAQAALPDYLGLRIGAVALRVCAVLYYIGAVLILLLAILSRADEPREVRALQAGSALAAASVGAVFHAISAACDAMRDMARNSFR